MTPSYLADTGIAFAGTVIALRDQRGISYIDPAMFTPGPTEPQCRFLAINGALKTSPADCLPYLDYKDMSEVVFNVEEPIRGAEIGKFVVPQNGNGSCGPTFELGRRYIYGAPTFNARGGALKGRVLIIGSMAWIVQPGMTVRDVLSRWGSPALGINWDPR